MGVAWTGLIWLRIGISWELLLTRWWNFQFRKMLNSWEAGRNAVSLERLNCGILREFLRQITFCRPWRWRQYMSPKRQQRYKVPGVESGKIIVRGTHEAPQKWQPPPPSPFPLPLLCPSSPSHCSVSLSPTSCWEDTENPRHVYCDLPKATGLY
jgi:hypothetical protein